MLWFRQIQGANGRETSGKRSGEDSVIALLPRRGSFCYFWYTWKVEPTPKDFQGGKFAIRYTTYANSSLALPSDFCQFFPPKGDMEFLSPVWLLVDASHGSLWAFWFYVFVLSFACMWSSFHVLLTSSLCLRSVKASDSAVKSFTSLPIFPLPALLNSFSPYKLFAHEVLPASSLRLLKSIWLFLFHCSPFP